MISVVIPLYNKADSIGRTLESLNHQTYKDFEIVVVNDGSTDGSEKIIERIADPKIRLINQPNGGVASARNKGFAEARAEYVALLDADDQWEPQFLETMAKMIADFPDCAIFGVDYVMRKPDGSSISTIIRGLDFEGDSGEIKNYFQVASQSNPPLCSSSVVINRDAMLAVGGFPVGIKSGEDLITWARLAARYRIAYCRIPLAIFNIEGYDVKERPKRIPPKEDYVGAELLKLKDEFHPKGINLYICHWHKMRSSIYMRLRQRRNSIREAAIGLRYNPMNYKLYAFIAINLLPSKLQPF